MRYGKLLFLFTLLAMLLTGVPVLAADGTNQVEKIPSARPSVMHQVLWYVPNRLSDLADIVRLRGRVGPGIALNFRATKWAVFYTGEYHSVAAGLPGPRLEPRWPLPAGFEQEKGLALLAVDATDTLDHEPVYSNSEFTIGLHVALVGAEAGFDPVEIVDFALGLILIDIRRDDH